MSKIYVPSISAIEIIRTLLGKALAYCRQAYASAFVTQVQRLIQRRERAASEHRQEEDISNGIDGYHHQVITARGQVVLARSGQGLYRAEMLALWGDKCAVTGCSLTAAIVASHAKRWVDSTDEERLDPNNGLPLIGTLDRLFDAGLIGFDPVTGEMHVPAVVTASNRKLLGIPAPLRRVPNSKQATFLRYHLDFVFQRENLD